MTEKSIILLENSFDEKDCDQIRKEFPQYELVVSERGQSINRETWPLVEVICGDHLDCEQMHLAENLRWLHVPTSDFNNICLAELMKRENTLVTTGYEEDADKVGEFLLGVILAYSKGLLNWHGFAHSSAQLQENPWEKQVWALKDKIFLQIGVERLSKKTAEILEKLDLKIWGASSEPNFKPYCQKVFNLDQLSEIISEADFISIFADEIPEHFIDLKLLNLMKQDAVLVVIGPHTAVNPKDLLQVIQQGKLRGVWLDTPISFRIPPSSPLWESSNVVITPSISSLPSSGKHQAFHIFHFNLRQFAYGYYTEMHHRILINL